MVEGPDINPNFDLDDPSTHLLVDGKGKIDAFFHHNLVYAYETPWNARVTIGANNLTDEDPPLDSGNTFDTNLYPHTGRALTVSYTQRF